MNELDTIALRFSPSGLLLLNAILALVMLGVALDLKPSDFRRMLTAGPAAALGLGAQFFVLPAITYGLVIWLDPQPSMALGMFLVAACPGGNISNVMTHLARGNTALSVSLSAVSTLAAMVMTPLNLAFWSNLYPPTRDLLRQVALDPLDMLLTVALLLAVPVSLGMGLAHRWPELARSARRPVRILSLGVFALFVVGALWVNLDYFLRFIGQVAGLVALHNALALLVGYTLARVARLRERDRRAVAIEVGIQNSGLGLILIFDFFGGLGGMAIVAAWWGVWHIVSGLTLAFWWSRHPPADAVS